jgi:hypothetical protein
MLSSIWWIYNKWCNNSFISNYIWILFRFLSRTSLKWWSTMIIFIDCWWRFLSFISRFCTFLFMFSCWSNWNIICIWWWSFFMWWIRFLFYLLMICINIIYWWMTTIFINNNRYWLLFLFSNTITTRTRREISFD